MFGTLFFKIMGQSCSQREDVEITFFFAVKLSFVKGTSNHLASGRMRYLTSNLPYPNQVPAVSM